MENRLIEKTGDKVSPLGFGAMRLPLKNGRIDRTKASKIIYHAIDNGINFIDTAYIYGDSEKFLGEILTEEYRKKVKLCTKLPAFQVRKYEDMEIILNEQLERLNIGCIDYYLIHSIDLKAMNRLLKKDLVKFLNSAKEQGKIMHVGFSYHGVKEEFEQLVDLYDWDAVMVQYNYFDENIQASNEGIEYAASKGMGVFIMEPLKGGILAGKMPDEAEDIFKKADSNKSNAQWAFEWVLNNPNISCVLSGMNSIEQVDENIKIANNITPLSMDLKDLDVIGDVKSVMRNSLKINCSTCGYCMPCPQDVNIPECMKIYNEKFLFNHKGLINQSLHDYYQYVSGIVANPANAGLCNGAVNV